MEQLDPWLEIRRELPIGALLCVIHRRFTPHKLRHAHAVEMAHEGVPFVVIQRQLGHANLGIASIYLPGTGRSERGGHHRPCVAVPYAKLNPAVLVIGGARLGQSPVKT